MTITITEAQQALDKAEDLLIDTAGMDHDITAELLDDYTVKAWSLKSIDDPYVLDQAIRVQDICDAIDNLPRVTNRVSEQHVIYLTILHICLAKVPTVNKKEE